MTRGADADVAYLYILYIYILNAYNSSAYRKTITDCIISRSIYTNYFPRFLPSGTKFLFLF